MEMRSCLENEWLSVFHLQGEIDAATAPPLQAALEEALGEGQRWFLIDLLETEFVDSVTVGLLLGSAKQAYEQGGMLAVVCQERIVMKVFEISGTKELLNVHDSEAAARSALEAAREASLQREDGGA